MVNLLDITKPLAIQNIVQNVEGKNIYAVTHGTFMSNFFTLLNEPKREEEARALLTEMLKDPKIKRSNYMRLLVKYKGINPVMDNGKVVLNKEGIEKFNYGLLDGLKNEETFGGVKYSNMTKEEYLAMSLGMFISGGTDTKNSTIATPGLTPSDKSTLYILQSPRWEQTTEFADSTGAINTKSLIGRLVMGELQGMRQEAMRLFEKPEAANLKLKKEATLQAFANPKKGTKKLLKKLQGHSLLHS